MQIPCHFARFHGVTAVPTSATRVPFSEKKRSTFVLTHTVVTRVEIDGRSWTVKDFSSRPRWVRFFIGPFLLNRELSILSHLTGIDGVSQEFFRIDRDALAVLFMDGNDIFDKPSLVTPVFLEALEDLLQAVHARDIVHLDVRGMGNVIVRPDGTPGVIDFQASLFTGRMPKFLRRFLEDIDMSGAFKKWLQFQPEAMSDERRKELERINRWRRFWVFRGYFGLKKTKQATP